jgi:rRNA-processing protein FCF1
MPNDYARGLIDKHRRTGLLLDANLLLVYFVGLCDREMIRSFKRTRAYTEADFELLRGLLSQFERIVTTPAVLTEVNSLGNQLQAKQRVSFLATFRTQVAVLEERHRPSREVCEHKPFEKCGLTDATIFRVAEQGLLVLTDDFQLAGYLSTQNVDCINFNHIRGLI